MPEIIPNLHPAVVHLPIALTLITLLFNGAARLLPSHRYTGSWTIVGHWTLWFAAGSALIAATLGWMAFNNVNHDEAGHLAMLLHRNWAMPTALGLILFAVWDGWRHKDTDRLSGPALVVLLVLSLAITKTAWLGGELVFRHGIGVLSPVDVTGGTLPPASSVNIPEPNAGHHHSHPHEH